MACACGKGKSGGLAANRTPADATAKARAEAAARAQTATQRINPQPVTTSGQTQQFALIRNGSTVSYGSRLERDAALARAGGTPI